MILNKDSLKYPQIDAAFRYIYDHQDKYIDLMDCYEFGIYKGNSLQKICNYIKNNKEELFNNYLPNVFAFDSFSGLPEEDPSIELFSKFGKGSYNISKLYDDPFEYIYNKVQYNNLFVFKTWFNQIEYQKQMGKAILVHIDCDLYSSTVDALKFMCQNNLLQTNSLIAFDEYQSTNTMAGEEKAWLEISNKYDIKSNEIWHNQYFDKLTNIQIRQSIFCVC